MAGLVGARRKLGETSGFRRGIGTIAALLIFSASAAAQGAVDPDLRTAYEAFYRGDKAAADTAFRAIASRPDDLAGAFGGLLVAHSRLGPDSAASPDFERDLDAFIDRIGTRYDRNHSDEAALFHLAFAYTLRSAYKFQHQKGIVGAARDGGRARGYIDKYLAVHPDNGDAHLVRGMYNYFVDLAPSFVHIFRFLLLLPAGNRVTGLKDIEYAADHGVLFGRLAQLQLVPIYGALEGRTADAVALGQRLERELPANDEVAFALADVYISPAVESRDEAGRMYEDVLERHRTDESADGVDTRFRATYGLAGARFEAWRCEEAIGTLSRVIDAPPSAPAWVLPRFLLRRAGYRMLLNDPHATDDVRRVLGDASMARWHDDARDVSKQLDAYRTEGDPALYAALVPANRLVAERRFDEARRQYEELARGRLDTPQVRYRLAYLDFARGLDAQARPTFAALAVSRDAPDWVRASSWLYVARIDDLAGQRTAALKAYQRVVDDYSSERASLAAQVGLISPYRRQAR
jgi:tetratricopeptide (TPR) repeat protein